MHRFFIIPIKQQLNLLLHNTHPLTKILKYSTGTSNWYLNSNISSKWPEILKRETNESGIFSNMRFFKMISEQCCLNGNTHFLQGI